MPISAFLDAIASEEAAPATGTAVAITGAVGAALCEMVCVHMSNAEAGTADDASVPGSDALGTDASDAGSDEPGELPKLRGRLERRRRKLLALGDRDAALVDGLFGDGGEPSTRLRRRAAGIPLAVSETALDVLVDAGAAHRRGRPGVAADAKTGAYLADAAVGASVETVRINTAALPDDRVAADLEDRAAAVERSAERVRRRVLGGRG